MKRVDGDWYDYPEFCDISFQSDTEDEAAFVDAAVRRWGPPRSRRLLDLGCGGGRMMLALHGRGYRVAGLDLNEATVRYATERLRGAGIAPRVRGGDMSRFKWNARFDAAYCMLNTFRHLSTEAAALEHLACVCAHLRPGGIYILAFHLLPPGAEERGSERWTERRDHLRVTTTRVLRVDRAARREATRYILRVRGPSVDLRLRTAVALRTYDRLQFRSLLRRAALFDLVSVHDSWFEIDRPRRLDDSLSDAVFVLRRRPDPTGAAGSGERHRHAG